MAEALPPQIPDRTISPYDIQELGFEYLIDQIEHLQQVHETLESPSYVPDGRQQDVNNYRHTLRTLITQIQNLVDQNNLENHGAFQIVMPPRAWLYGHNGGQ